MARVHTAQVKQFWSYRAEQVTRDDEVTHRDVWQRWLEIEMIKRYLRRGARVLDIGCGNGWTTRQIAPLVKEVVGVDYSDSMIARASVKKGRGRISYHVGDVLRLSPEDFGRFDLVLSERCLINLKSWKEQQRGIANIASILKPGGTFVFLEGCKDGRESLNRMRRSVGLSRMPNVWHNRDFETKKTLTYLRKFFAVKEVRHFGVYDFIARVVHPLLAAPGAPKYDAKINEIAALLSRDVQALGDLSRVMFVVLRRTARRTRGHA